MFYNCVIAVLPSLQKPDTTVDCWPIQGAAEKTNNKNCHFWEMNNNLIVIMTRVAVTSYFKLCKRISRNSKHIFGQEQSGFSKKRLFCGQINKCTDWLIERFALPLLHYFWARVICFDVHATVNKLPAFCVLLIICCLPKSWAVIPYWSLTS